MLYEFMSKLGDRIDEYGQQQFSQFGEDVALWAWVETLGLMDDRGFYVDVGAHHPRRGSNTYLLRKLLGWKGVNIEPDPNLFAAFPIECPDCINLPIAIGPSDGKVELTVYNHPAANTVSETLKARQAADPRMEVVATVSVDMRPLNSILEEHLPSDRDFRLLTVDAEGLDYEIVSSLDVERHRPNLIMVEDFEFALANPASSKLFRHLDAAGYSPVSHCMVTTIYRKLR